MYFQMSWSFYKSMNNFYMLWTFGEYFFENVRNTFSNYHHLLLNGKNIFLRSRELFLNEFTFFNISWTFSLDVENLFKLHEQMCRYMLDILSKKI